MKKIAYTTLLKIAMSLVSIAFLVACGGSKTNIEKENTVATSNFDLSVNGPEVATNADDNTQIPALTLTALDHLPTIDENQVETANTMAIGAKVGASSNLRQKSSVGNHITEPVLGFIVKYKNQANSPSKTLGITPLTTIQTKAQVTALAMLDNSQLTGASQILASGMSVGMANVASKNNIQLSLIATRYNSSKVFNLSSILDFKEAKKIAQEMQAADPNIEYVALNKIKRASFTPNDPGFTDYYLPGLKDASPFGIKAETAWNTSNGAGVIVAVLDTGYRPHKDMRGTILPGYDFISNPYIAWDFQKNPNNDRDSDARDTGDWVPENYCGEGSPAQYSSWHGTHVAGTIATNTNNKLGIASLAYGAKVLPVRVLGSCGGVDTDIVDAIIWAAGGTIPDVPINKTPAKIINLSLGGASEVEGVCDILYEEAIATARSLGAIVVVAAGNGVYSSDLFENVGVDASNTSPANCSDAITVAASDTSGYKAKFSNFGSIVDISAPGVRVLSLINQGAYNPTTDYYAFRTGTSMATPHVSAALALMLSANPRMTAEQAEQYIKQSVRPFATSGCTSAGGCGSGILDASKAVITYTSARAPSDFDGNSKTDLVYRKSLATYDEIYLAYINGSKQTISKSFNTSKLKSIVAIGDFNGDRRTDILEASTASGKLANFIYMNGNKVNKIKTVVGSQPANSFVIGAADLNADGKDDLLLRNSSGDFIVGLMPSNGTPNLSYTTVVEGGVPSNFAFKGVGDTNRDGKLEVFWQDLASNKLKVITMSGNTLVSHETGSAAGLIIEGVGRLLDKTADGILVRDRITNAISVISAHSGGTFTSEVILQNTKLIPLILPSNMVIAGIGDYNGNGQDDILWRQINSSKAGILSMSGWFYTSVALPALATTLVVQGKP